MKINKNLREKQGVYAVHINLENISYVYLGSGKLADRISGNISKLKRNVHANPTLQEAYNIVGECKIEVLGVCESIEEARAAEQDLINFYKKLEDVVVCNKYKAVTMEKPYKRVLDVEKVKEIKTLIAEGIMKINDIALAYGVKACTITKIKHGYRWSNVNIDVQA
ncbi:hypothetical protein LL033_17355 [Clostridium estertheticum]|uniref:hypothetical protein n=1 Tax=Clostridium estertheticum TaxID=238834 RepID=UPI001C0C3BFE|nr:hypothetical protein [Clostridium estertheticum]MBU3216663.1 hypothetical protein [Clostridium estertheticum]WAG54381.1 hypothetical protein LL033_17355 [Clostridium estertheticum]